MKVYVIMRGNLFARLRGNPFEGYLAADETTDAPSSARWGSTKEELQNIINRDIFPQHREGLRIVKVDING